MGSLGRVDIRAVGADELTAYLRFVERSYGEQSSDAEVASWLRLLDHRRLLAATTRGGMLVGSAGSFAFDISLPGGGRAPCAGVTLVSVRQDHRRRGVMTELMTRVLADVRARGEPFAALWSSEAPIYGRFGFGPAMPTLRLELDRADLRLRAPVATHDVELVEGAVAAARLSVVYERARAQRPGMLSRGDAWWDRLVNHDPPHDRGGAGPLVLAALGERGYVRFRLEPSWSRGVADGIVHVEELVATDAAATAALWTFAGSTDLAARVRADGRPVDDPLPAMLVDPGRLTATRAAPVYLRLVDVAAALQARRYAADGRVVLDVADPALPDQAGIWALEVTGGVGACTRPAGDEAADLSMTAEELGAMALGGVRASMLVQAGRVVEHTPGAARRADQLLGWAPAPWHTGVF